MILTKFLLLTHLSYSYVSCEQKLVQYKWPLDCFMELTLKKTRPLSKPYLLLDDWCELFEDKLVKHTPPEALFSLYLPKKCSEIAFKALKHHQRVQIIEGTFLNSFL